MQFYFIYFVIDRLRKPCFTTLLDIEDRDINNAFDSKEIELKAIVHCQLRS